MAQQESESVSTPFERAVNELIRHAQWKLGIPLPYSKLSLLKHYYPEENILDLELTMVKLGHLCNICGAEKSPKAICCEVK